MELEEFGGVDSQIHTHRGLHQKWLVLLVCNQLNPHPLYGVEHGMGHLLHKHLGVGLHHSAAPQCVGIILL